MITHVLIPHFQLNSFISAHPPGSSSESNLYTQIVLLVEQNIDWLNNNGDALRDWLQLHQPSRDLTGSAIYRLPVSTQQHWASVKRSYQNAHPWRISKQFWTINIIEYYYALYN